MNMIMLSVLAVGYLVAQPEELMLYKETDHFKIFCTPIDNIASDEMLTQEELFFNQLVSEFNHTCSKQVQLHIYPDLISFHQAINWPDAPDWVIGHGTHKRKTVSPRNPGPFHSFNKVMRANKSALTMLFIQDKYKNKKNIPYWFEQGVGLFKADFYANEKLSDLLPSDISLLPSLEQLEAVEKYNTKAFDKLNGFRVSFSIIQFIDQKWGWNTILELLENYSQFEEVVGCSKLEFKEQWLSFLIEKMQ